MFGHSMPRMGRRGSEWVRRHLPDHLHSELFPGIQVEMRLTDAVDGSTFWLGRRFEEPTGAILSAWCAEPGSRFFDIGSHFGFFSLWMHADHPACEIYAFEPNPATFERLRTIQRDNQLARLHPFHLGLGDATGRLQMTCYAENSGASTFAQSGADLPISDKVWVPVETFDAWVEENQIAPEGNWVAKIDTEGFELRILRGMTKALAARRFRGLSIELNREVLAANRLNARDVPDFLAPYGYRLLSRLECLRYGRRFRTENVFFVREEEK
jgi:FkbM family methyltransferase